MTVYVQSRVTFGSVLGEIRVSIEKCMLLMLLLSSCDQLSVLAPPGSVPAGGTVRILAVVKAVY